MTHELKQEQDTQRHLSSDILSPEKHQQVGWSVLKIYNERSANKLNNDRREKKHMPPSAEDLLPKICSKRENRKKKEKEKETNYTVQEATAMGRTFFIGENVLACPLQISKQHPLGWLIVIYKTANK